MSNIIVFDIETGLNEDRFELLHKEFDKAELEPQEFDPSVVKVGNLKDEEKIAAKIEAERQKHEEAQERAAQDWQSEFMDHYFKQREKAALYPGLSEIVAIGWQVKGCEPVTAIVGTDVESESDLITLFLNVFHNALDQEREGGARRRWGFWSGNSGRSNYFDYLHIKEACRRNLINPGAEFLVPPDDRGSHFLDLVDDYTNCGPILPKQDAWPRWLSLNDAVKYTRGFGMECDQIVRKRGGKAEPWIVGDKENLEVEGATFHEWVCTGDKENIEKARRYLVNDLAATRWIAEHRVGSI